MIRFLLDTNTASYLIRGDPPQVRRTAAKVPLASVAISAITEAELRFGVARRPDDAALRDGVSVFLRSANILPWDSPAAGAFASLRAKCLADRTPLVGLDLLIAAHAIAADAVLVTSDAAFYKVKDRRLKLIDWANGG